MSMSMSMAMAMAMAMSGVGRRASRNALRDEGGASSYAGARRNAPKRRLRRVVGQSRITAGGTAARRE
ncbi:hypothetical protein WG70_10310 [Burkholderia oklahomensis EO147]|nr:hypothetical protein WG70_10310 [Burkholderia oklahomensis EO147]KUY62134.1 hypothetical protein WG70_05410 [Burkholderia oklahomensis EO147]